MLVAAFLPEAWHAALPRRPEAPTPAVSGVRLLRISLALEGLALAAAALALRGRLRPVPREALVGAGRRDDPPARPGERIALALIVIAAAALRWYRLDTDLWFDEITTVAYYRDPSFLQVIATYINSNNHLLNTLLMKVSIRAFGDVEWAVRLPAALFGVATVPLAYLAARLAMSRRASLAAAALLACSYHHVFYSQNARGYTAQLFFSILAAVALVRALGGDGARWWALASSTCFLNLATLLTSAFVVAGQAIAAGGAALLAARRSAVSPWPLLQRVGICFAVAGALALDLYAPVLPDISAFMSRTYTQASSGFGFWSGEIFVELARGLGAGFGAGLLLGAAPFLAVAGWGLWLLARRAPLLTAALALPLAMIAAYLLVKGFTFSPRFFLLGLPLAILGVACLLDEGAEAARRRFGARAAPRFFVAATALLALASLVALVPYYRVPKQDYRGAFTAIAERRQAGDGIIGVYLMGPGFQRYAPEFGWTAGDDYVVVRSLEEFRAAEARHPRSLAVTTFSRGLRLDFPDLRQELSDGWREVARFPGSIGDGAIVVLEKK